MTADILLTGGTGTLGRQVTPLLRRAGRPVRVLSRSAHEPGDGVEYVVGDLDTGAGVAAAVAGVEVVVHCAGAQKGDDVKTAHLVEALRGTGSPHLVFISGVGADRVPVHSAVDRAMFAYFASKRAAELVVEQSGLPWTTLRATQFHDLVWIVVQALSRLPVLPAPRGVRFQPVDTGEVAQRLVELALGPASGLVPDLAGPEAHEFGDLLRSYLRATGKRRPLVPVPVLGAAGRAIKEGANLNLDRAVGRRTWEQFLADRVAAGTA
jgi:uncharacterized protein YbjT (DUF2867 family)